MLCVIRWARRLCRPNQHASRLELHAAILWRFLLCVSDGNFWRGRGSTLLFCLLCIELFIDSEFGRPATICVPLQEKRVIPMLDSCVR
ncbi:hypothetical protein NEOLEDRAFT_337568 [Neolentinus lepideus HHB14362 ss-1]|uniref:Uncharacterized protein n=1 Tax=Neolentinus lepideus HHB14362 ss-1 TaxID=1314782 RepID=A0A165SVK3_9AGAM|nr:hypothetical protein NEOLEDRAFT_337568 [Neolentinus lepideus HHB14362 ss-1]